jgi:serine phosphatase RsbU (regulator of sigma subunit)/anti-sigma regulatory factor (Ser/Thr protein kinase)
MRKFDEREPAQTVADNSLRSLRVVMARAIDVVWRADASGGVTGVTPCRPNERAGDGELDDTEVAQLEEHWRRCAQVVERFSGVYHIRNDAQAAQTFLIRAVPVLDERDAVLYWEGIAAETDDFPEPDTRFISEVAAVLSSSLNYSTIINRLAHTSIDRFCDLCAIFTRATDGTIGLAATARSGPLAAFAQEALQKLATEAIDARQPRLLVGTANSRSMIVAPLLVGKSCAGAIAFLESKRVSSFEAHDVDTAIIVARQLAMALERIKTIDRERANTERFVYLARATDALFTSLDPSRTFELLLEGLVDGFADYAVAARLSDAKLKTIASAATRAQFRDTVELEIIANLGERRAILSSGISDVRRGRHLHQGPLLETKRPRSWMMVPLFLGDAVYGTIVCCSNTHAFDRDELELFKEIGRRASLALEHAETFAREQRLTQTLQQATLPTRLATIANVSLSAVYRPAALELKVGGDWYDAFDLDEHRVLLTVGDVTGHGLEASIVMGKLRHAINVAAMYEPDPVRILDAAERILVRRFPGSVATAFVAIFDSRLGTITYANAGHPYPILRYGDGSMKELEADGLPIGMRSLGPPGRALTKRLENASLLAFYTDGLVEATRDLLVGERLLRTALASDAALFVDNAAGLVEQFCLDGPSPDDVAIIILNFVQSQRWAFDSRDRRAARRARREFLRSLARQAASGADLYAAEVIFGELAANAVQHAGSRIEVALEWVARQAVLHVIDRGSGYVSADRQAPDPLVERGRGLWLVQRLGATLEVEVLPGFGTHVRAMLPIRQPDFAV